MCFSWKAVSIPLEARRELRPSKCNDRKIIARTGKNMLQVLTAALYVSELANCSRATLV